MWGHKRRPFRTVKKRLHEYPDIGFHTVTNTPSPRAADSESLQSKVHKCIKKDDRKKGGHLVRGRSKLVEVNQGVVDQLILKHPDGPLRPFGEGTGPAHASITIENLCTAANSFDDSTGVGISGWNARLLKFLMKNIASEFVQAMLLLANLMANGTAPGATILCSSILLPLSKPNNGIRPIAIGELIYRMITKAALIAVFNVIPRALHPHQFGVNTPGGVEPLIALINNTFERHLANVGDPSITTTEMFLAQLDQANAFNTASRILLCEAIRLYCPGLWKLCEWIYNQPSQLVIYNPSSRTGNTVIYSKTGVKQGCPLSPFLYSMCIRKIFTELEAFIHSHDPAAIVAAYLDDITILSSDPNILTKVTAFLNTPEIIAEIGLRLNEEKCSIASFSSMATGGVKLLGSFVGSHEGRQNFLHAKIQKTKQHILTLRQLKYQDALIIFKSCINPELIHLARSMDTSDLLEEWSSLDHVGLQFINYITGLSDSPTHSELTTQVRNLLTYLPVRLGGIGITNYSTVRGPARIGFINAAADFLTSLNLPHFLPYTDNRIDGDFITQASAMLDIHTSNRTALYGLPQTYFSRSFMFDRNNDIANAWLHLLPRTKSSTFSNLEVSLALTKLQQLQPPGSTLCRYCQEVITPNHEENCKKINNVRIYRHNALRNCANRHLIDTKKQDGTLSTAPVTLEARLHDTDTSLKRIDLRIVGSNYDNAGGMDYDFAITALTEAKLNKIERDRPAIKNEVMRATEEPSSAVSDHIVWNRERQKIIKYRNTKYAFRPLIITTGGTMNHYFKTFIKDGLKGTGTSFKRECSAILVKYNAMLYPTELRNYS